MTKQEIVNIVKDLDAELKKSAAEAATQLKKAEGDKPDEDTSSPAPDASASSPADSASAPAPTSDPAASATPPAPADASAAPADPAQDQGPLTPEALQAEYAQLDPQSLDMHIQAALAAKEALSATSAGGAPGAAGPVGGPPAPDASAAPPMAAAKGEINMNKEAQGDLGKSQKEFEELKSLLKAQAEEIKSLKASQDELKKSQSEDAEALTKAVKLVLETPRQRAVTSISDLKKNEAPKKVEYKDAHELIKANVSKMTKAERELWLDFTSKKIPASKLENMLERLSNI